MTVDTQDTSNLNLYESADSQLYVRPPPRTLLNGELVFVLQLHSRWHDGHLMKQVISSQGIGWVFARWLKETA